VGRPFFFFWEPFADPPGDRNGKLSRLLSTPRSTTPVWHQRYTIPAGTKGEPLDCLGRRETCPSRKHAKTPDPWLTQMKVATLPQTHKRPAITRRDAACLQKEEGAASTSTWGKPNSTVQGIYLNLRVIATWEPSWLHRRPFARNLLCSLYQVLHGHGCLPCGPPSLRLVRSLQECTKYRKGACLGPVRRC
jgi:hypothetical protein